MKVLKIIPDTTVDGDGLRTSIYFAGCNHYCKGCHNPESWNKNNGTEMSITEILDEIKKNKYCNVTLSGGDPLCQNLYELNKLLIKIKELNKTIWIYTGYKYEDLISTKLTNNLILPYCDIIVDGEYIESLRNTNLKFRGSENQRIIDVQKSLKKGKIILHN